MVHRLQQALVATHNVLFFLILRLNDNSLPILEALCKPSEVKERDSALPPEVRGITTYPRFSSVGKLRLIVLLSPARASTSS